MNILSMMSLKMQIFVLFLSMISHHPQPASLLEVSPTVFLKCVPLVIFILPTVWTGTYSHCVGISRKSFCSHYQQRQTPIQFLHPGYIRTANFCWLCLAVKFKHASRVTQLHRLRYISSWTAHCHRIPAFRLPKHTSLTVLTRFSTLTTTDSCLVGLQTVRCQGHQQRWSLR